MVHRTNLYSDRLRVSSSGFSGRLMALRTKPALLSVNDRKNERSFKLNNENTSLIIPKPVKEIIDLLRVAKSGSDISDIFTASVIDLSFKKLSNTTIEYGGFQLKNTFQTYGDVEAENIKIANELGLQCAPKLVEYIKAGRNEAILITHYPGCEAQPSIAYGNAQTPVSTKAKEIFLKDMETLADNGFVHSYVQQGNLNLSVDPASSKIFINEWSAFEEILPKDRKSVLGLIKQNLGISFGNPNE